MGWLQGSEGHGFMGTNTRAQAASGKLLTLVATTLHKTTMKRFTAAKKKHLFGIV